MINGEIVEVDSNLLPQQSFNLQLSWAYDMLTYKVADKVCLFHLVFALFGAFDVFYLGNGFDKVQNLLRLPDHIKAVILQRFHNMRQNSLIFSKPIFQGFVIKYVKILEKLDSGSLRSFDMDGFYSEFVFGLALIRHSFMLRASVRVVRFLINPFRRFRLLDILGNLFLRSSPLIDFFHEPSLTRATYSFIIRIQLFLL